MTICGGFTVHVEFVLTRGGGGIRFCGQEGGGGEFDFVCGGGGGGLDFVGGRGGGGKLDFVDINFSCVVAVTLFCSIKFLQDNLNLKC